MTVRAASRQLPTAQGKFQGHPVVFLDVCLGEITTTEDVTGHAPDPAWRFSDPERHEHYATQEDLKADGVTVKQIVNYPTLKFTDRTYWCEDCHDDHTERQWHCRWCGYNVTPGERITTQSIVTEVLRTLDFSLMQSDFYRHAADATGTIVIAADTKWQVELDGEVWDVVLNSPAYAGEPWDPIKMHQVGPPVPVHA